MSQIAKMKARTESAEFRFVQAFCDANRSLAFLQEIGMTHGCRGAKFLREQAVFLRNHIEEIEKVVTELPDYIGE